MKSQQFSFTLPDRRREELAVLASTCGQTMSGWLNTMISNSWHSLWGENVDPRTVALAVDQTRRVAVARADGRMVRARS